MLIKAERIISRKGMEERDMRKKTVAANWKMNMTRSEAKSLLGELVPMIKDTDTDIIICAPFLTIQTVLDCVEGTDIHVGAENMYFEDKGAYTGEISPVMLKEAGVTHVILGHSERRKYFGETNEIVNKKIIKALEYGLVPMACCGESLEIRGDGLAKQYIHRQIMEMLQGVQKEDVSSCIFSYEPIWAIGTGRTATPEQAQAVCAAIRATLVELFGAELADSLRILYGGSMNVGNVESLFAQPDIDGGLVGGASLKASSFIDLVKACL